MFLGFLVYLHACMGGQFRRREIEICVANFSYPCSRTWYSYWIWSVVISYNFHGRALMEVDFLYTVSVGDSAGFNIFILPAEIFKRCLKCKAQK